MGWIETKKHVAHLTKYNSWKKKPQRFPFISQPHNHTINMFKNKIHNKELAKMLALDALDVSEIHAKKTSIHFTSHTHKSTPS